MLSRRATGIFLREGRGYKLGCSNLFVAKRKSPSHFLRLSDMAREGSVI